MCELVKKIVGVGAWSNYWDSLLVYIFQLYSEPVDGTCMRLKVLMWGQLVALFMVEQQIFLRTDSFIHYRISNYYRRTNLCPL
jgi:hypothetical protein